jgi:hypothetical protein
MSVRWVITVMVPEISSSPPPPPVEHPASAIAATATAATEVMCLIAISWYSCLR